MPTPTRDYLCGYDCPEGWRAIVEPVLDKLEAMPDVTIAQVKQKFGGLRIYVGLARRDWKSHPAMKLIAEAVELCARTCESCGGAGRSEQTTWGGLRTLCANCHAKLARERA